MMTNSQTFGSEPEQSSAFSRLHPRMQRWIYDRGWTSLHDAQERAIGPILDGRDVIIAAATAAGKTEATFLPILSALAASDTDTTPYSDPWTVHDPWAEPESKATIGIQVLYLSPLKALINDQYERLEELCDRADIAVHRWHGDVSTSSRQEMLRNPSGVLLITPESLEATFVNRGTQVPGVFAELRYMVVDELHSFLATPRGAQLQSLMARVELAIRRRPPRIGLSATLGDMPQAAAFLRPTDPKRVVAIESAAEGRELRLQLRGYVAAPPPSESGASTSKATGHEVTVEEAPTGDRAAIAEHLFHHLRGRDNLVFANARGLVETYADLLARRSTNARVPNEFSPHHGNLSRDARETVEAQLKDPTRPTTAICTSTLEMGIDIGSVASVAQIGPPPSVASLRQRLGRSGRREIDPAEMRLYVSEKHLDERSNPVDELRCSIVQTIAMVRLMLDRWLEAPDDPGFNYSTLIQQILSAIAQHGGATAVELYRALCGPGPFELVDKARFARLLRAMAAHDLLAQASDGLLLHGTVGERHVNHYSFYAAFQTADEWRLVASGRILGTVPLFQPLYEGVLLIFAGRRWKVINVDSSARVVELEQSSGGKPPLFGGGGSAVSDRVRKEMLAVYAFADTPPWLDKGAQALLAEGRAAFGRYGLSDTSVIPTGSGVILLPWAGDRTLFTATIALHSQDIAASVEGPAIEVLKQGIEEVEAAIQHLLTSDRPRSVDLAKLLKNREIDKWDWALEESIACESAAARLLDVDAAWTMFGSIAADLAEVRSAADSIRSRDAVAASPVPSTFPARATVGQHLAGPSQIAPGASLARLEIRDHEFCVLDVETTGFSPRLGDRVIEIGMVRLRADGTPVSEWSTLIDPGRDIRATHVHGIRAADIAGAPRFAEVVSDILHHMSNAVLVAHNLRFDRSFLDAEFSHAGLDLPKFPALCTLSLGSLLQPGGANRRLSICCERLGIDQPRAHDALADARAASKILVAYLEMAHERGLRTLDEIGCVPLIWPTELPTAEPSAGRQLRRTGNADAFSPSDYLSDVVHRLHDAPTQDPDTAAYHELLDRALEDRRLTDAETAALAATATEWGLSADRVKLAHEQYFDSVLEVALADDVISDSEYRDLLLVSQLLGMSHNTFDNRVRKTISARLPSNANTAQSLSNES